MLLWGVRMGWELGSRSAEFGSLESLLKGSEFHFKIETGGVEDASEQLFRKHTQMLLRCSHKSSPWRILTFHFLFLGSTPASVSSAKNPSNRLRSCTRGRTYFTGRKWLIGDTGWWISFVPYSASMSTAFVSVLLNDQQSLCVLTQRL